MPSDVNIPVAPASAVFDHRLLAAYYDEFRSLARRALNRADRRITIQPTDLAHEAAMRLLAGAPMAFTDEAHFLALSANAIRATLIDEIRRRRAAKRDVALVTSWDEETDVGAPVDIEQFDRLIDDLATIDPEAAAVVQLRFYVGLTMAEIARELKLSESTALRRWRIARAWLLKELATSD